LLRVNSPTHLISTPSIFTRLQYTMKSTIIFSSLFAGSVIAAPLSKREDAPTSGGAVFDQLIALCDKIGGTPISSTVCKTVTGLDIGVAAADPTTGGLAKVTLSGGGLLQGASITIPVASLDSMLGQLSKRSSSPVTVDPVSRQEYSTAVEHLAY
jgi:hypothetical protein